MELNEFGQIALEQWHKLSDRFPNIELDAFVVMPNHVHGIIFITENGPQQQREQSRDGQPQGLPRKDSNNAIMGADIGQPVGAGLAPAQNGNGQPPGFGQPQGLPLQDSNYACAQMQLNEFGQIALEQWYKLADRFQNIELDAFVVMPNHVHGIIFITENGPQQQRGQSRDGQPPGFGQPRGLPLQDSNNAIIGADNGQPVGAGLAPARNGNRQPQESGQPQGLPLPKRTTLGDVVGAYKSLVSNECLKIYKTKNETMGKLWQRNYYEHIIRDEKSYENIVYYIENNPSTWQQDELFGGEIL
jgi:REP element-mobilizing transposase RayT